MKKESRFVASAEERARLKEIGRTVNKNAGIIGASVQTVEQVRESIREQLEKRGIMPEDRPALRELLQMRYGSESDEAK